MNDKQKRAAVVGGGALAVGYFVLSQKGKGGGGGGGSVFGKVGSGLSLPGADNTGGASNPASTIADILSNIPPIPGYSDSGFGTPPPAAAMAGIPQVMHTNGGGGGGSPITKKSTGGGLLGTLSLIPKVGVYSVMKPTQILGGAAAHLEHGFEPLIFSKKHLKAHHEAQQRRRRKYPRTVHAMSMLTGGVIKHGPLTKKQRSFRKHHPTITHAWKSLFGWLGA